MSALSGCRDVTGWRGEKWGKNRGREGKAERRHNQVRGGDTRAGRGAGEVWFCTGAGVLVVTWAVTAGRRWKRGPTGWRQMRGGGVRRVTAKEEKGLIPFPVHYRGMSSAGMGRVPAASCSRSSGAKLVFVGTLGPLSQWPSTSISSFSRRVSTHTQSEDGGRRVHLHVFMRNITADGRCVKKHSERDQKKRSFTLWRKILHQVLQRTVFNIHYSTDYCSDYSISLLNVQKLLSKSFHHQFCFSVWFCFPFFSSLLINHQGFTTLL